MNFSFHEAAVAEFFKEILKIEDKLVKPSLSFSLHPNHTHHKKKTGFNQEGGGEYNVSSFHNF